MGRVRMVRANELDVGLLEAGTGPLAPAGDARVPPLTLDPVLFSDYQQLKRFFSLFLFGNSLARTTEVVAADQMAFLGRRRPGVDDRAALAGSIYQLRTGIPWRLLPTRQLGCGSPVTCWRRLPDWQRASVWQRLHHRLLDQLGRNSQLDWSRASLDSISVCAKRGAH